MKPICYRLVSSNFGIFTRVSVVIGKTRDHVFSFSTCMCGIITTKFFTREVVDMRRFLAVLILAVALISMGRMAKFILGVDVTTLLPSDISDSPSMMVAKHIFEGLITYDENMNITPVLATSWEVSEDGTEYVFHLRKGVKFHDGTPFNAQAVKKTFDYILSHNVAYRKKLFEPYLKSVEVVDEYTVKFTLKFPFAPFLNFMCHPAAMIVSPKAMEKYDDPAELGKHPVGTGPFVFKEWVPGEKVVLVKNENYWKSGFPKLDGVIFSPIPEGVTRALKVQTGSADLAVNIPVVLADKLKKDPKVDVVKAPTLRVVFIGFNLKRKPFDDVRVRRALNYAVDKETLCKTIMRGLASPSDSPVSIFIKDHHDTGGYPYDVEKAKKLLAEAGYPNGFEVELITPKGRYPQDYETAIAVQSMLKKVGVKVKVTTMEWPTYVNRILKTDNYDMYLVGWSPSTGEAIWVLDPLLTKGSIFNLSYYYNPEFEKILDEAKKTIDPDKRHELLAKAQDIVVKDAPWIFLYNIYQIFAKSSKLKNVKAIPTESILLNEAYFGE